MAPLNPGDTLGILGGGQLGRMLAIAAAKLGLHVHIFDPDSAAPAAEVAWQHTCAAYTDTNALKAFAEACAVVTFEFENIPELSLQTIDAVSAVRPGLRSLATSQDRLSEKQFLEGLGLPVAPFRAISKLDDLSPALAQLGGDAILKTRRLGYDGKGQARLNGDAPDLTQAWETIGGAPAVLEQRIAFEYEISAVIVRAANGDMAAYDTPINVHESGILRTSHVGAHFGPIVPSNLQAHAQESAKAIASALDHIGILAVEFFAAEDGPLLVNEIAPRVHNTGHWTMEGCTCDQFENHVRAVAGLPLGSTQRHLDVEMTNLLGREVLSAQADLSDPACSLHLYGKAEPRKGRKMGHLNRVAPCTHS